MTTYKDDCVFCRELAGQRDTNFARLYPDRADSGRLIAEDVHFVAFPCIGQLVPTHVLIVPRFHIATMREACGQGNAWMQSFRTVLSRVHEHFGASRESTLFFEHGVHDPSGGGCGIYHAHLHVLPGAGHIRADQLGIEPRAKHFRSIEDALGYPEKSDNYILAGSSDAEVATQTIVDRLPSQTLRQRVAAALGISQNWDWHSAGREQTLLDALEARA